MGVGPMTSLSLRDGLTIAGRYRVTKPLGRGAYGAVYEAMRRADGAIVALKIMHAVHAETTDALRFEREAALLKRLQSPHVVAIIDFGHHDEMPFLVFERLEGRNLAEELVAVGALSAARTGRIARQVLAALEEAHSLSIVHRDIKPANIFVGAGRGDLVKVLDFGIAKALRGDVGAALTATGQMLGTAQYMAPEQVRGEDVAETADIYSLGTVMAEMLTGAKLVAGANELEVYMRHISDKPLELPEAVIQSPLGAIIARACAKRPADRFSSAAAMAQELDRALAMLPQAGPTGTMLLDDHSEISEPASEERSRSGDPTLPPWNDREAAALLRPAVPARRPRTFMWALVAVFVVLCLVIGAGAALMLLSR
jgi:serine/threonine-protein kinase